MRRRARAAVILTAVVLAAVGGAPPAGGLGEEQGAHKISLDVWPHNEAARNVYRRFGFAEEG
jgi:hypothetical protein